MVNKVLNQKTALDPVTRGDTVPEYPWVSGETDVNGQSKKKYADPDNPNKSYVEQVNHDGSYQINEVIEGEGGLENKLAINQRTYSTSKSTHVEGNRDDYAYNSSIVHKNTSGQQAESSYIASSIRINSTVGEANIIVPSSENNGFNSASGDGTEQYKNHFVNVDEEIV